jgi:dihydrofolate reductase
MRKLVVSEFVTLDGVMEAPGRETSLGDRGGWVFKSANPEMRAYRHSELFESDALLLGRSTYEIFAAAWPTMTDENGFADRMNSIRKYVATTTLTRPEWNNTTVIAGNVPDEVARLKAQEGQNILLVGSGTLVRALLPHKLVDEIRLMVFPVLLGAGQRLFSEGIYLDRFELVNATTIGSGIALLVYESKSN